MLMTVPAPNDSQDAPGPNVRLISNTKPGPDNGQESTSWFALLETRSAGRVVDDGTPLRIDDLPDVAAPAPAAVVGDASSAYGGDHERA